MANSLFAVGESWSQASIWLKKGDVIEVSAPTEAKRVRLEVRDKETGEWDATKTGHLPLPHRSSEGSALKQQFGVRGIPALIIVSPDGKTITKNGRGDVSSNPKGAIKAWSKSS